MKQKTLTVITCICVLLICACNNTSPVEATNLVKLKQKDTIDYATYQNWQGAWMSQGKYYTDSVLTEYFTMPLIDLSEFAKQQNHVAARYILGLDTMVIPHMPHLMLVGVDSLGQSMLPTTPSSTYQIYDVTIPCPKFCGDNSIK